MPPIVLTFAASDPTGGAGLQADLLTLAALGCHPLSVVTGAHGAGHARRRAPRSGRGRIWSRARRARCSPTCGSRRSRSACSASADNVRAVAAIAAEHADVPLVLDPVLASGRGDALASDAVRARAARGARAARDVLTPNSLEARAARRRAARCSSLGARYVLVTGTHDDTRRSDQPALRRERPGARGPLAAAARAAITARAARSPPRSPPRSPRGAACPRRCAKRRSSPGKRSPPASAPAPASCCRTGSTANDARPVRHHAGHRRHRLRSPPKSSRR